jgi:hypothetical protein
LNRAIGFLVYAVLVLAALGAGAVVFRRLKGRGLTQRWAAASLPLSAVVVVWSWLTTIGIDPVLIPWSAARLAPAMGQRYGYRLYSPPNSGPATGWIYPPVATLAYFPATLIPDATGAVLAGRLLTLVYFFAPVAWLLMTERTDRARNVGLSGALLFCVFALLARDSRPLHYCSTEIHADAPALGLAALATGLLARTRPTDRPWRNATALLLASLSVWTKQLTAPVILVVLPLWAYLIGGLRGLLQYVAMAVAVGLSVSLWLLAAFGAGSTVFNVFQVPLLHPRRADSLVGVARAALELQQRQLLLLLLLATGAIGLLTLRGRDRVRRQGLASEPWLLFLLVGVAELPISGLAYLKVGGDDNNLGFMLYFLTIAALLMHRRLMPPQRAQHGDADRTTASFRGIFVLNLILTVLVMQQTALAFAHEGATWQNEQKAALRYIQHHRGEAYFPWHPLEHLAAEGRLYHFEYGVFDRILAGYPLTSDHFCQHIPPDTHLVCYPPRTTVGDRVTLKYLDDFVEKVEVAELPGWECYRRPKRPGALLESRALGAEDADAAR